jgi:hypothetical protein
LTPSLAWFPWSRSTRAGIILGLAIATSIATSIPGRALAQTTPPATPPTEEARRDAAKAFKEGVKAFAAKDYATAALRFEEADHLAPHPSAVWNLARSLDHAGQRARAANAYLRYLRDAPPDAPDREEATRSLDALAQQLVRVDVTARAAFDTVLLDGHPIDPGTIYADSGPHTVEAHAADQVVRADATGVAGAFIPITLSLPPLAPPAPAPAPSAPPPVAPAPTPTAISTSASPPPPPSPSHGWSPVVFWISAGTTAALLGTAIGLGVDTLSFKNGTYDSAPASQQPADYSNGVGRMNRTNILFGCAGAAAVFTAVTGIWLTSWHGSHAAPPDAPATATLALGPGSLQLLGTFR